MINRSSDFGPHPRNPAPKRRLSGDDRKPRSCGQIDTHDPEETLSHRLRMGMEAEPAAYGCIQGLIIDSTGLQDCDLCMNLAAYTDS
jgi:hypothetical protein